jgi:hypothetical protein
VLDIVVAGKSDHAEGRGRSPSRNNYSIDACKVFQTEWVACHGNVSPEIQMKYNDLCAKINGYDNSLMIFTGETCCEAESNHRMKILSFRNRQNFTDSISKYSRLEIPENFAAWPDSSNIIDYPLDIHFHEI